MDTRKRLTAIGIVGLAFWWPFLRNSITGFLFTSAVEGLAPGYELFLTLAFTTVIVLSVSACFRKRLEHPLSIWGVFLLCAASTVADAMTWLYSDAVALQVAAAAVFALCYVALPTCWTALLKAGFGDDNRAVACILLASYALSFAIGCLSYLPEPISLVRPLLSPLITGALLVAYAKNLKPGPRPADRAPDGSRASESRTAGDGPAETGRRQRDAGWLASYACTVALYVLGSIPIGIIQSGSVEYQPSDLTFVRDIMNIFFAGTLALVVHFARSSEHDGLLLIILPTIGMLGGAVCVSLSSGFAFMVGFGALVAGKSCLSVALLMMAYRTLPSRSQSGGVACILREIPLFFVIPTLLTSSFWTEVVPLIVGNTAFTYEGFWGMASLLLGVAISGCLICFLMALVLNARTPNARKDDRTQTNSEAGALIGATVVRRIAETYSLTDRETELLRLISEGNTFKRAGEHMALSTSTVQTHAKSLYRKLGVHTRQEVVDLVRRFCSEAKAFR